MSFSPVSDPEGFVFTFLWTMVKCPEKNSTKEYLHDLIHLFLNIYIYICNNVYSIVYVYIYTCIYIYSIISNHTYLIIYNHIVIYHIYFWDLIETFGGIWVSLLYYFAAFVYPLIHNWIHCRSSTFCLVLHFPSKSCSNTISVGKEFIHVTV